MFSQSSAEPIEEVRENWQPIGRHLVILITLVALALTVRLPFLDAPGFAIDINLYVAWSETATNQGLPRLYDRDDFNYPPVASYLFLLVGHLQRDILNRPFAVDSTSMLAALKLPAMVCDLAITVVLYLFLIQRSSRFIAIAGALAFALNPAVIYDSMIWGQWDSLVALPLLLTTMCLIVSRPHLAAGFFVTALLIKFQAVVVLPVVLVVIIRRHGLRGLMMSALAGLLTAFVLLIPVIVTGQVSEIVDIYVGLTSAQPWVSNNAYNLWWLVNWLQSGSPTMTLEDGEPLLGPITYKHTALSLYALAVTGIVAALARARLTAETISLAAAASVIAFFTLAPEMHERYLFPALPILILAFNTRLHRWLLAILSLTLFFNLRWVLLSSEGVRWSVPQLAATGLLSVVNLAILSWIGVELFHRSTRATAIQRRAWLAGAGAVLSVVTLASVTILRWYIRDVRG